jgi:hypothetical protein
MVCDSCWVFNLGMIRDAATLRQATDNRQHRREWKVELVVYGAVNSECIMTPIKTSGFYLDIVPVPAARLSREIDSDVIPKMTNIGIWNGHCHDPSNKWYMFKVLPSSPARV